MTTDNKERDKGSQEHKRPERRNAPPQQYRNPRGPRGQEQKYDREAPTYISVVVPLLNEEDSLPELALQLQSELEKMTSGRYEVIFIDDGSTDSSFNVIKQINQRNNKFRCIRFRRNYGKSAALSVGFREARGKFVVTMDADLQDDPAELKKMIDKLHEGYDLVSGWKQNRKDPISKTLPSKFFNFVTSIASGLKLHDYNCGLKAYRREVVKTVNLYGDMHRYIPFLAFREGFRVTEIPVTHHARRYGKSKFGVSRLMTGYLDLLTVIFTGKYLKRPLHFFGTLGTLSAMAGLITDGWLTVEWALGRTSLSNRPLALMGVALIIVGVQFISMGLLGEMITRNTLELNQNNYSIKEKL